MAHPVQKNDRHGFVVGLLACLLFGIYPPAARAAYAGGANPVFMVLFMTAIRAAALVTFCFLKKEPLFDSPVHRREALTGGFWQAVTIFGMITALAYLPGPLVLIIVLSHSLLLMLFLAWRGKMTLDVPAVAATSGALLGLSFVLDLWHPQPAANWVGMGLAFMAALASVSRLYVFGRQMRRRSPPAVGAESFLVALVLVCFLLLWKQPHLPQSAAAWGWAALCAAAQAAGTFGAFYCIAFFGAFRWSLFSKIEPVFTSIFSVLFLGEILKSTQYAGILLTLGCLVLFQIFSRARDEL